MVFSVPSRDITNQTLPDRERFNYSQPGRVWLVTLTSRLGMGKTITFTIGHSVKSVIRIFPYKATTSQVIFTHNDSTSYDKIYYTFDKFQLYCDVITLYSVQCTVHILKDPTFLS
jgi:hypothetical protein